MKTKLFLALLITVLTNCPAGAIPKTNTSKIQLQTPTLEEVKAKLKTLIDCCALSEKQGKHYIATFQGNYIHFDVVTKSSHKVIPWLTFDLSKVYRFDENSLRNNDRAYVNIWTQQLRWPDREGDKRFDKFKLVLRVEGQQKAEELLYTFHQYHELLQL